MTRRLHPLFHTLWVGAWLVSGLLAGSLLEGCSPADKPAPAGVARPSYKTPAEQYAALAQMAKGIATGPATSDYTVYVVFDPQCLHCARLWGESQSLLGTVRFVWIPVAFFDARNTAPAAALLGSSNPKDDMDQFAASIMAHAGATPVPEQVPPYLDAVVRANTELVGRFHVLTIPYIVARNQTSSLYVAHEGGMSKEMLKNFLGIGSR